LNGKYFQNISGDVLHQQRFFSHLGSDGKCTLEVNFGMTHFRYIPNETNKYNTTEELNKKILKQMKFKKKKKKKKKNLKKIN